MIGQGVGKTAFTVSGDSIAITGEDAEQKQQAVICTPPSSRIRSRSCCREVEDVRRRRTRRATTPPARQPSRRCAPTTSASNRSPRRWAISIRASTTARWTRSRRTSNGPASIASRRICGFRRRTPRTPTASPRPGRTGQPSTPASARAYADASSSPTSQELYDYVHSQTTSLTRSNEQGIAGLSNGAIALLDEVATGKITGEEDWWSGTDLYDFAANVEGSKMAFSLVRDFAFRRATTARSSSPRSSRATRPWRSRSPSTGRERGRLRRLRGAHRGRQARSDRRHQRARRAAVPADVDHPGEPRCPTNATSRSARGRQARPTRRAPAPVPRTGPSPPRDDAGAGTVAAARRGLSRRGMAGVRAAGAAVGAAAGVAVGRPRGADAAASRSTRSSARTRPGSRRRSRITCTSRRSTCRRTDRDDLIELLQDWSYAASRMSPDWRSARRARWAGPRGSADDTGEALGLAASGLTITFGFGPTLFDSPTGVDRYGIAGAAARRG